MADGILVVLTILYIVVSVKIDEWITIYALGFKSDTPILFLQNQSIFQIVRSILFLGAAISLFFTSMVVWYIGLIVLVFVWVVAGLIGRKRGFARYRHILQEMVEVADSPEDKKQYEISLSMTDDELFERIK